MFEKLFAQSGLSLERLRALVEVGASGGIVRAAGSDPVRQSQYSRQIKELEDFFQVELVERHGKGIRLTPSGKELARISRFFLLGLSNFQRGSLAEGQTYRIGAGPTFAALFLVPILADPGRVQSRVRFTVEPATDEEIERRLHELTLDFGIVTRAALSRPLQVRDLGSWRLRLWAPKTLCRGEKQAARAFEEKRLPLAWPGVELSRAEVPGMADFEPSLACGSFLEAGAALEKEGVAAFLPGFMRIAKPARFIEVRLPRAVAGQGSFTYRLAWNPRLLRLNPHAGRRRDMLAESLSARLASA